MLLPIEGLSSKLADQERAALLAALRYLDAALGHPTAPAARILALICILRADATGTARLSRGLLRALRLAHHSDLLLAVLTDQRWLHVVVEPSGQRPGPTRGGVPVRIADLRGGVALPGTPRSARRPLLDRTVRLLTPPRLRATDEATRLAALHPAADPGRTALHHTCSLERPP